MAVAEMDSTGDGQASEPDEHAILLEKVDQGEIVRVEETFSWMLLHWAGFFVGGFTFVIGTLLYFHPSWEYGAACSAALYTLGSLGFLTVDVMEFFTFTEIPIIRINISCSMTGSLFYVIGSIGFFPELYNRTDVIGIWGFILGSFFIGTSQLWKTYRIGKGKGDKFSITNLFTDEDAYTQVGVELNAGFGAWSFFIGTIMYLHGPLEGPWYIHVLYIWTAGSFFFLLGSFSLAYRHFIMKI
jgi:hypothetical protein